MYTVLQICASFIIVGQVKCFVFNQYTKETPHLLIMFVMCGGRVTSCHYMVTFSPLPTLKSCKKCRTKWFGIPTQCAPVLNRYQAEQEFHRWLSGLDALLKNVTPICHFGCGAFFLRTASLPSPVKSTQQQQLVNSNRINSAM